MRKIYFLIVIVALASALLAGCAKKAKEAPPRPEEISRRGGEYAPEAAPATPTTFEGEKKMKAGDVAAGEAGEPVGPGDILSGVPKVDAAEIAGELKLIKTGTLSCEVEDIDEGFDAVYAVAKAEKGIVVETSRAVAEDGYAYGSITIKVHPVKYDETIRALRKIGRLEEENNTTQDVTAEYVDLTARLENAEAARERYLALLAERTASVPDILEVEREIERVTESVERLKGQIRYLDSQIGLATITVHLEEPHRAFASRYRFGTAIRDAFRIALRICIFLIQAIIVLAPFIIILIILLLILKVVIWYFVRRRRRAKKAVAS